MIWFFVALGDLFHYFLATWIAFVVYHFTGAKTFK